MECDWTMNGLGTGIRGKLNIALQEAFQANSSAGKHLGGAEKLEHT